MTYGIGNTSLVRAKKLEDYFNIDELYLKLEGENPTGTHKDRLAIQHVDDALIRGYETITVGSCGNYGVAMSFVANKTELDCKIFIPKKYTSNEIDRIKSYGAEIFRVEGGYEESVDESRRMAEKKGWYDANPGKKNTPISLIAYTEISKEIQEELGSSPKTVSVAVGNGTTIAGLHLGFRLLWRKKRAEDIPKMLAGSSMGNNAIVETIRRNSKDILEMDPDSLDETEVNEPLLNWRALDGQEAINAIYDTGGTAIGLSDEEIIHYKELLEKENISLIPCSSSALGATHKYLQDYETDGVHVVVITSGVKDV
ncbi:MAG: pyridoxal-phosphate dependent enzyme [Candidatus Thermoplasmatota archaeon]|nr:pyridoxal-phosphate dependent enzyme [Candidatus Thermoplasmatota archaeon]